METGLLLYIGKEGTLQEMTFSREAMLPESQTLGVYANRQGEIPGRLYVMSDQSGRALSIQGSL